MAVLDEGAWQETFLLGVTKKGGSEVQFAGVTEEISPEQADKDGEGVALGNGGRIWKRTPEGDFECTIKIYPISVDVTDGDDMVQYFLGGSYDSTAPISQVNTRARDLFRLAILWTDDSTATTAGGASASGSAARRIVVEDCRIVGYKESFDDKIYSAEVKFKAPAYKQNGNGNITRQSVKAADATALTALGSYS